MSVFFYYGSLVDATITEGDVTCDVQHPITNLNYLDRGLTVEFDDSGILNTSSEDSNLDLIKIDMGAATAVTSCVIDIGSLAIALSNDTSNFTNVKINLFGSSDGTTYTNIDTIYDGTPSPASDSYSETLNEIYELIFTEVTYRYYKIKLSFSPDNGNVTWSIAGNINNLYIGDYLEMPSPELVNDELEHDVELMTSYGGKRVAVEKQKQRKIWNYDYLNLTDAEKTAQTDFDVVAGRGKIPVYFENVSGTTQKEDLTYCRVTNKTSRQETASGNHSTSQIIEEEL